MPERIDTKAVLDGINAAIRGNGKPSAETLLAWWKALAQEIADREADLARIEALEELVAAERDLPLKIVPDYEDSKYTEKHERAALARKRANMPLSRP